MVSVVAVLVWPTQVEDATATLGELRVPAEVEAASVGAYLEMLDSRGVALSAQGIRVESLDGSLILADHQADRAFNPASVVKVATSLAALERFGPDHRFQTAFYVDGTVTDAGVLEGDLILAGDGDPELDTSDLVRLAREVVRQGIRRVAGDLVISGPFTVGNLHRPRQVGRFVPQTLGRTGLGVPAEVTYGEVRGTRVAHRTSEPLRDLLFYQNAHSDNEMADRLGTALGGPGAVEEYLTRQVGLSADELRVSRTSGLRVNRITPRGTIMVLRKLAYWLESRGMHPADVLPIAGTDPGTLRLRFNDRASRGAVVAKTGTLVRTDDGVSTLAGILYTEDHGPLLFAVFNTRGPVIEYRSFQDRFLKNLLAEYGGMPLANASSHRVGDLALSR